MQNGKSGFTLIELLTVTLIMSFCLVGMMKLFILGAAQANLTGNKTLAVSEAQDKIEEIRDHIFNGIVPDYSSGGTPGNTFSLDHLDGIGNVVIDNSNPELLKIEVSVFWRDKNSRIVGEDINLNGQLDAGEDSNANGKLDSPVKIMSMITRR